MGSKVILLATIVLAGLQITIGCSGGVAPDLSAFDTDTSSDADNDADSDGDSDGDSDSDSDGDSDTESACGEVEVEFDMETPTVVLLIDQSSSMYDAFGSGDRWTTVRDALLHPDTGVIIQLQEVVRFSLQLYTSNNGFSEGDCPLLTGTEPSLNAYNAIDEVFHDNQPIDDTPTGESIDAVVDILQDDPHPDSKIIVLATDGEPDYCEVPDPQTDEAMAMSVTAAQNALAQGYKTYIISVGADIGIDHLNDMAEAGQGTSDAQPYQALDQAALVGAFEEIVYGVRNCALELNGEVQSEMVDQCVVTINEQELTYDVDWQLNNPSEIEIVGDACDEIQHGVVTIDVWCPCDAIVVE